VVILFIWMLLASGEPAIARRIPAIFHSYLGIQTILVFVVKSF
jgi:hypothetical protein